MHAFWSKHLVSFTFHFVKLYKINKIYITCKQSVQWCVQNHIQGDKEVMFTNIKQYSNICLVNKQKCRINLESIICSDNI